MTLADMNSDLNITVDFFRSIRTCYGACTNAASFTNVFPDGARDWITLRKDGSRGIQPKLFATIASIACNYVQTSICVAVIVSHRRSGALIQIPMSEIEYGQVDEFPWHTKTFPLRRKHDCSDPGLLLMPKWKFTHRPLTHFLQGLPLCPCNRCSPFVAGNGQIVIRSRACNTLK